VSNTQAGNALRVIHPYRHLGTWVFDDADVGLVKEPFVAGIDTLLDRKAAEIGAGDRLTLVFSTRYFPGANVHLEWTREEAEGNWYHDVESGEEGWLCPALYRYFDEAPDELWIQVKAR
jgi:hypothetical protein